MSFTTSSGVTISSVEVTSAWELDWGVEELYEDEDCASHQLFPNGTPRRRAPHNAINQMALEESRRNQEGYQEVLRTTSATRHAEYEERSAEREESWSPTERVAKEIFLTGGRNVTDYELKNTMAPTHLSGAQEKDGVAETPFQDFIALLSNLPPVLSEIVNEAFRNFDSSPEEMAAMLRTLLGKVNVRGNKRVYMRNHDRLGYYIDKKTRMLVRFSCERSVFFFFLLFFLLLLLLLPSVIDSN
jgi:hypothetical protein